MIAGSELAAWLGDRDRQEATYKSRQAFAKKWTNKPLFLDIEREFAAMSVPTLKGVRAAAERFIGRQEEIAALISEIISDSAADPYLIPSFFSNLSDIHASLQLFEHPNLSIGINVTGADALAAKKSGKRGITSIGFTGHLTLFHFVKAGGAMLSFWKAPAIEQSFAGSTSGQCVCVGRRKIEDGENFIVDGRSESFIIEHAYSDIVFLQAIIRIEGAPLTVEYDSSSFEFLGANSTDEGSSRIQMMVSLLRLMDRSDAAPIIAEALYSPYFYTRWHIMRELLALDAEFALPYLREMAKQDPHAEVRSAAQKTLDTFFAEDDGAQPGDVPCPA